jgi:hypothetical protein
MSIFWAAAGKRVASGPQNVARLCSLPRGSHSMPAPEDLWRRLVEEAGDDPVESAAAVSVSQAERELKAAGFDTKAERERASALIRELTGEGPSASVPSVPSQPASEPTAWVGPASQPGRRSSTSRYALLLAAALAAVATAGGILYGLAHRPKPKDNPVEPPRPGPSATATPTGTPSATATPTSTTSAPPRGEEKQRPGKPSAR